MPTSIIKHSVFFCVACSNEEDIQKITEQVNKLYETGTDSKWFLSKQEPVQCEKNKNFKHYLFNFF